MNRKPVEGMEHLRPITLDDLKTATGDTYFVFVGQRNSAGQFVRVRVNGKPKTWKRRPLNVKVPWKYGLYEYGHLTQTDIATGQWYVEMKNEEKAKEVSEFTTERQQEAQSEDR